MSEKSLKTSAVYWLTGLPCSGKSTLAERLVDRLRAGGAQVEWLDGDKVRAALPGIGFDMSAREQYLRHIAFLASVLERNGITVVASFVSPYRASRAFARSICRSFVEIYVSTPLLECERRDTKGLYKKARTGEIAAFTGVSDPYEVPEKPELSIDTTTVSVDECVSRILSVRGRPEEDGPA